MSEQVSLFEARDEAIDRVERNADEEWRDAAYRCVERAVRNGDAEITSDLIWAYLHAYYWDIHTHDPRAMGAVFRRAQKEGLIVRTDRTRPSTRKECHLREIRIWRAA